MRALFILALLYLIRGVVRRIRNWWNHRKLVRQLESLGGSVETMSRQDVARTAESARRKAADPVLLTTPDGALPFGYKTGWLAVRCDDPEQVMDALDLFDQRTPANWATGLAAAEAGAGTFVTPCLDGWVLAIDFYESARGLIEGIAGNFPEAQYFCTHRVTEYHTWVKYVNGKTVREYCYAGERGEVLWDEGEITPEELSLGFDRFPRKGQDWTDGTRLPDEEDVLDIAAAWGVDPRMRLTSYPPALGWFCQ